MKTECFDCDNDAVGDDEEVAQLIDARLDTITLMDQVAGIIAEVDDVVKGVSNLDIYLPTTDGLYTGQSELEDMKDWLSEELSRRGLCEQCHQKLLDEV